MIKSLYLFLIFIFLSNQAFCANGTGQSCGSNCMASKKNNFVFENGKVNDQFITENDYRVKYGMHIEKGNTSHVTLDCKSNNSLGCHKNNHTNVNYVGNYRFVPVPVNSNEQFNPYASMMLRDRIIAPVKQDECRCLSPTNCNCNKDVVVPEVQEVIEDVPEEPKEPWFTWKLLKIMEGYKSFGFVFGNGGSSMTAYEVNLGGYYYENYSLDKTYSKIGGLRFESGINIYDIWSVGVEAMGLAISGDYENLDASIRDDYLIFTGDYSADDITFNPSQSYGNGKYIHAMLNTQINLFPNSFMTLFGGGGIGQAGFLYNDKIQSGFMDVYSVFGGISFDIGDGDFMYFAYRKIMSLNDQSFDHSTVDIDINCSVDAEDCLPNERYLQSKGVNVVDFEMDLLEFGFKTKDRSIPKQANFA